MKVAITFILVLIQNFVFAQTKADYKVYSEIINHITMNKNVFKNDTLRKSIVIIENSTNNFQLSNTEITAILDSLPSLEKPIEYQSKLVVIKMLLSFKQNSAKYNPFLNENSLKCLFPIHLISESEFNSYFPPIYPGIGWQIFYSLYPKSIGVLSFSKIVYLDNLAVCFVDYSYGSLGGNEDIYIMKLIKGKWIYFNKYKISDT